MRREIHRPGLGLFFLFTLALLVAGCRPTVVDVYKRQMEDFVLDLIVGKGPGAKNVRLKLPRFTVIGATTRLALMTAPLRARFGAVYRMDFYDQAARCV